MNINILKSFFTLESLNILRCYISFNNIIHKPKLMLPEFFIVITRFNRTRYNRTRYNRTLILSTATMSMVIYFHDFKVQQILLNCQRFREYF